MYLNRHLHCAALHTTVLDMKLSAAASKVPVLQKLIHTALSVHANARHKGLEANSIASFCAAATLEQIFRWPHGCELQLISQSRQSHRVVQELLISQRYGPGGVHHMQSTALAKAGIHQTKILVLPIAGLDLFSLTSAVL